MAYGAQAKRINCYYKSKRPVLLRNDCYAKIPELKTEAKKVYEAIRYSDPMSNPALSDLEAQIFNKFNEFSSTVKSENMETTKTVAGELLTLIQNRNKKCKLLK